MPRTDVILLSPHCDDIAYSLGGRLAAHRLPADRCEIRTIFTRSPYCPMDCITETDVNKVTCLRLAEDRLFTTRLGLAHSFDDLPDAVLRRRYPSLKNVRVHREAALRDPILGIVCTIMADIRTQRQPECIVAPLAIGGHADHWIVRLAAEFVFEEDGTLVYYEDLPYAGYLSERDLSKEVQASCQGLQASILADDGWLESKLALLQIYKSQVSQTDMEAVKVAASRAGGERMWFLESRGATVLGLM